MKKKLRPELDGQFWMIGDNPDLGELQGPHIDPRQPDRAYPQEPVDHHIYQGPDGAWHLWGCIRGTGVGRILYHWEGESLTTPHWRLTGEIIRADRGAGESMLYQESAEWIQSPYVIQYGGRYWMFYGGFASEVDEAGWPQEGKTRAGDEGFDGQICLMTSTDGRHWVRHRNEQGHSRLFVGPGETRDPCLVEIDGIWHLYYAGYHGGRRSNHGFYVRTSADLIHWSDWRCVHQDPRPRFGARRYDTECPHVVERGGYTYLFRTEDYALAKTHVFRSEDPLDFGVGDARSYYVCDIAVAAPEIIVDSAADGGDGSEYITSNHNLNGGTMLCRLRWVDDS